MAATVQSVAAKCAISVRRLEVRPTRAVRPRAVGAVKAEQHKDENKAAAAFVGASPMLFAGAANASELGEDLYAAVEQLDKFFGAVEDVYGQATVVAGKAAEVAETAAPAFERLGQAAAPVGSSIAKLAERTVLPATEEALKAGASAAAGAVSAAGGALQSQGVDVAPIVSTVKSSAGVAADTLIAAKPAVQDAASFVSSSSPTDIVEIGVAVGAAYVLTPALFGAIGSAARGYSGSIRAVMAYDQILTEGNTIVVDVRREDEVSSKGCIDVPRRFSKKVFYLPREKLQGSYKAISDVEAKLTALKIASLKGVAAGKKVFLLDSNGNDAPAIAKELTAQGFGSVSIIEGGFSAWLAAGLGSKTGAKSVRAELLPGMSFTPLPAGRSTQVVDVSVSRGFLPSGRN